MYVWDNSYICVRMVLLLAKPVEQPASVASRDAYLPSTRAAYEPCWFLRRNKKNYVHSGCAGDHGLACMQDDKMNQNVCEQGC
jgi:hypothetical protein